MDVLVKQWDPLTAYFRLEAAGSGSDVHMCRLLADMYQPKNKVVLVFVADQIGHLNQLNKAFQGEQPNQSKLLDHLFSFFYSILDFILTSNGVDRVKSSPDPFSFDFTPFLKGPESIHFG